ncbi:hypothetical protein LTR93_003143 [Exophiala xenobiotica]|nr:hypothetical protein LTR93_003143 [Exophiala xenobiotica]
MVSHTRTRSRGSFSILSFDSIRSFSRACSRQASRIPSKDELNDRAESSLSYRCDPHDQPPAASGPGPTIDTDVAVKPQSLEKEENCAGNTGPQNGRCAAQESTTFRRRNRFRPLSWLSFSQFPFGTHYPRSHSVHLPKATSTSTDARSVISVPILTSTTNVEVARAEGVVCGEISDLTFSGTRWDPVIGWVADTPEQQNEKGLPHNGMDGEMLPEPNSASVLEIPENTTTSKRGSMLRLSDTIKSKVRRVPARMRPGRACQPQKFDSIAEDADERAATDGLESSLARRRAETVNLYKGKIKGLTGNGHVRRKSLNSSKELAKSRPDAPLLGEFTGSQVPDIDAGAEQSDNEESGFGSLTKSFASAVEKLDFHSPLPRNMSFLRSKSSFFHPKKESNGDGEPAEMRQQVRTMPPARPARPGPSAPSAPVAPVTILPPAPPLAAQVLQPTLGPLVPPAAAREPVKKAPGHLAMQRSAPSPVVFSTEANAYVPTIPASGYPRGVNPLRMHPPDMFASPPSLTGTNGSPAPPQRQIPTPSGQSDDDDDLLSLEDAPIYSPSLGDLSTYARDTPRSDRYNEAGLSRARAVDATPTRAGTPEKKTLKEQGGKLLKKSKSGLFSRSKSSKTMAMPRNQTLSPLYERDTNEKLNTKDENTVKKSRSMHFGGLFKKESHSDWSTPMPRDVVPFQPATPSPLRNVTRVSRGSDTIHTKVESSPSRLQHPRR